MLRDKSKKGKKLFEMNGIRLDGEFGDLYYHLGEPYNDGVVYLTTDGHIFQAMRNNRQGILICGLDLETLQAGLKINNSKNNSKKPDQLTLNEPIRLLFNLHYFQSVIIIQICFAAGLNEYILIFFKYFFQLEHLHL